MHSFHHSDHLTTCDHGTAYIPSAPPMQTEKHKAYPVCQLRINEKDIIEALLLYPQ